MEGMLGTATTGSKHVQMLSDKSSKTYKAMKRGAEEGSKWQKRLSNLTFGRRQKEKQPDLC